MTVTGLPFDDFRALLRDLPGPHTAALVAELSGSGVALADTIAGIRRASARPEILARCRRFFERNPAIEATTSYGGGLGELEHRRESEKRANGVPLANVAGAGHQHRPALCFPVHAGSLQATPARGVQGGRC